MVPDGYPSWRKPSRLYSPKYFFKNGPPFKGRTYIHTWRARIPPNKPHFQEKYFPPFAPESPKPDYPGQNCLLSKTYFKGSKRAYYSIIPLPPRRMTSLIKILISEKEIFNVSPPLGTGVNDLSSLRTIPPQSWRIVSRDHHSKATHRFSNFRSGDSSSSTAEKKEKKKQIVPPGEPYLSLVHRRRTVYLSRISHGSGLPAFMRRGTKAHERKPARCCSREQERGRWKGEKKGDRERRK